MTTTDDALAVDKIECAHGPTIAAAIMAALENAQA
jgi:hypothetical protein